MERIIKDEENYWGWRELLKMKRIIEDEEDKENYWGWRELLKMKRIIDKVELKGVKVNIFFILFWFCITVIGLVVNFI